MLQRFQVVHRLSVWNGNMQDLAGELLMTADNLATCAGNKPLVLAVCLQRRVAEFCERRSL